MGTILTCKDLIFTHRHSASGIQIGPISFELEEGESFGIVGESGSGKTSIFKWWGVPASLLLHVPYSSTPEFSFVTR